MKHQHRKETATSPPTLRIMTYNIHKGIQFYSRRFVLKELREAIQEVQADVVFLQEVMGESRGAKAQKSQSPSVQFEYLADSVWSHFAYGKNSAYSEGHHGNAILSKYPILRWENWNISTNRLERRGALHAVIKPPVFSRDLHLLCLHLNLLERGRDQQIEWLIERVQKEIPSDASLIVAGDFNDWREKATEKLALSLCLDEVGLVGHGAHLKTFPSWLPVLPLDRIYFRGAKMFSSGLVVGARWRKLSDHQALLAELAFA